jgi:hypothetical protein
MYIINYSKLLFYLLQGGCQKHKYIFFSWVHDSNQWKIRVTDVLKQRSYINSKSPSLA